MVDTAIALSHGGCQFDTVEGLCGTGFVRHGLTPPFARSTVGSTISESNVAYWTENLYSRTWHESLRTDHELGNMFLSASEEAFLTRIVRDLSELPKSAGLARCADLLRQFVQSAGLMLAHIPSARCAIFGDEEDGLSLVAHSRVSKRQVTFEFNPENDSIAIISIDEDMQRFERTCEIDKVRTLSKAIAWLSSR